MKINKNEKTGANTVELELFVEPDALQAAISQVYKKEGKKYNVPGFRKGHAPRNLIEKMYGEDVFALDALNEIFPQAFEEAVKEAGLDPVGSPDVELVSVHQGEGAVLKVIVTVKPEVKVGKYKGLAAAKKAEKVAKEQIQAEIERMRQRNARLVTRDGAAEDGDTANIDYEGFVGDEAFEGGKDDGYDLKLGSASFIPGFEEQVVGHKAGEEFDVKVTFPAEYHAEHLAGKEAVFKVKLNEVKYTDLPALDDEFAKDVSEFDTLTELEASIEADMQKELDEQADREFENALVEQIVETMEGEIPDVMYEERINDMVRNFAFRLEQQGLNLPTYLQYTGMDEKAFRDGFREQAEKQVKMRLALEAVRDAEGITATEEDVQKEIDRMAESYKMEADKIRELMNMEEIAEDLAVNKALDLIKDNAKVVAEKKAEAKKDDK